MKKYLYIIIIAGKCSLNAMNPIAVITTAFTKAKYDSFSHMSCSYTSY